MTATQIDAELGCSVTAVCRALTREHLETAGQRQQRERHGRREGLAACN